MILSKKEYRLKTGSTRLIPFRLSSIQEDLQNTAAPRNITVKPRQIGSTTWHIICRLFLASILEPGTSGLLISQTKGYGAQHFRIFLRALKNFGRTPAFIGQVGSKLMNQFADDLQHHLLHTQYSARHEILFDFLDSKVLVDTAENPDAGTGLTINHLVATEVAYWKRDPETLLAQAKEAIPSTGTMDLESTPNGMGGYFFEEWQRAQEPLAEFRSHFYPWWQQKEYQAEHLREEKYQAGNIVVDFEDKPVTDAELKMAKEFAWTMKQIAWKRGKVISLRKRFEEKYPENSSTCFLTTGDLYFDKDTLRDIKMRIMKEKPIETFHEGTLKIYKRRIPGRRYIIGADCAEGRLISTDNPDRNAAVVLEMETGEECAAYSSVLPPEDFAQDLVDLAEMYNRAQIAPERNGPGQTVILAITRQLLYGNIYMHKEWHKEKKTVIPIAGFPTTPRTRPIACNRLGAMLREAPEFWHDEEAINECLTFVWMATNKTQFGGKRTPQGAQGCKDDRVAARWVAAYCRLVGLGYLDPIEVPSERYGDYEGWEEEDAA